MKPSFTMRSVGALALFASAPALAGGNLLQFRTIALTGQQAPGAPDGALYSSFSSLPVINNSGNVAFAAILAGTGVTASNSAGIWSDRTGSLGLDIRRGDLAPSLLGGAIIDSFSSPLLNNSGHIGLSLRLSGPGITTSNDMGLWTDAGGGFAPMVREGDQAAGLPAGVVYTSLDGFAFNDSGRFAFTASIAGPGVVNFTNAGVWSEGAGSLSLVARKGHLYAEGNNAISSFTSPAMNNAGSVAFTTIGTSYYGEPGYNATLFTNRTGVLTDSGTNSTNAFTCVINSDGDIAGKIGFGYWNASQYAGYRAFRSSVNGPSNSITPGFVVSCSVPVINAQGRIAYIGGEGGGGIPPNPYTITPIVCADITGAAAVVARWGQQAVGADAGQNYANFGAVAINDLNQVVLSGALTGPGVTSSNSGALWLFSPYESRMLLRTGDLFDINDDPVLDDLRTISNFSFLSSSGGEDGRASSFNDQGELALRITFTDGSSGLFVIAVPTPASGAIFVIGGVFAIRRRR